VGKKMLQYFTFFRGNMDAHLVHVVLGGCYAARGRHTSPISIALQYLIIFHIFLTDFTEKNDFVTAAKLRTTNNFFVAATKNFAAVTNSFVDRTKDFVVVTKYFCYPYFNK